MLPLVETIEQFRALDLRSPVFADAAIKAVRHLKMTANTTSFPSSGSLPVVFVDDKVVVKFFPPFFIGEHETETKALKFLSDFEVPQLLGVGQIDGWHYVIMTKLIGQSLKTLWPELSPKLRQSACRKIGTSLRNLHSLKLSSDFDVNSWTHFLALQKQNCFKRH